jgi:outer membrane protein
MKKIFSTSLFALTAMFAFSQNYMVVNTQEIFKSLDSYNKAITELDTLSSQYQQKIDAAYEVLQNMYDSYQNEKASLSESARQTKENDIIKAEQKIANYQEEVFGQNGTMINKRIEMLKPIQDKVFAAINAYAEKNNFELVLDIASNPTILYYLPAKNKTEQIINQLK